MTAPMWKQASQRSDEGTIGRPKPRTLLLTSQHRQLVPQHEQFDVLGELDAATPNKQPQDSREGKIGEGEEHQPILPGPANLR